MPKPLVCIASGPSLTQADCDAVRGLPAIVINTSYLLALWAPYLYACDPWWWGEHIKDVRESFKGELWTQDATAAKRYELNYIKSEKKEGLSRNPEVIYQGSNSGYQAINLAYHFGARRIILLGYDMMEHGHRHHWHKEHRNAVVNPYAVWLKYFDKLADDLKADGISVINCTRSTALRCFKTAALEEELAKSVVPAT